jgi:hypothetical protein
VSVAFRAKLLTEIVEKAKLWCDFVPVEGMVWLFEDDTHKPANIPGEDNWVEHVGRIFAKRQRRNG